MSDNPLSINGELLRLKREARGWLIGDMATRACMSVKQIRQLEEGGSSSFYSESVKLTSAKKVGAILGLTAEEVMGQPSPSDVSDDVSAPTVASVEESIDAQWPQTPEPAKQDAPPDATHEPSVPARHNAVSSLAKLEQAGHAQSQAGHDMQTKHKTPLGAIAALFVAALAVAWWMRPDAEPVAIEPPPPLQTLPADAIEPAASAASDSQAPVEAASAAASGVSAGAMSRPLQSASNAVGMTGVGRPAASAASAPLSSGPASAATPSGSKPL